MSAPNFTLDAIDSVSVEGLAELPAEMLGELQREVGDVLSLARRRLGRLTDALDSKYRERAAALRRQDGKNFGVVRFEDGEVTIEADSKKSVIWDQAGLRKLADLIAAAFDDPEKYITTKTELTVSERAFAQWSQQIQAAFMPYRTVKSGGLSYKVITEQDKG